MNHSQRRWLWLVLLVSCLLAGCASPAQPKAMAGRNVPHVATTHDPVVVRVLGGEKTNPMLAPQISNGDFSSALIESLKQTGFFKSVENSGNAVFHLDTTIEDIEQPVAGLDMTVSLRVDWLLSRISDHQVLWHDKILSTYTAMVGDAFVGIKRLRLANEGAACQNIEKGLAKLASVKF